MILLHDRNRILKSSDTHERKTREAENGIIEKLGGGKTENKNMLL